MLGPNQISILIDTSSVEAHFSLERAYIDHDFCETPIFLDSGDLIGSVELIKISPENGSCEGYVSISREKFVAKTGHNPEDFILVPRFEAEYFKIGTRYILIDFKLKLISADENTNDTGNGEITKCHCEFIKIYRRNLIVKTGSEKVICALFNNGLITEMNRVSRQIGGYRSPDTYYDPTFSICNVDDVKDQNKYIVRGLTGWRSTGHGTIEFNNANARSYMRTTVDMNVDDLTGKCAVFDSSNGEFNENNVVCFDQFITCKDVYKFRFETENHDSLFNNGDRMIFGQIKYADRYGTTVALGMLGRSHNGLTFIHADRNHVTTTFSLSEILHDPDWEFEIRDCRFCESVPIELAYLKEES